MNEQHRVRCVLCGVLSHSVSLESLIFKEIGLGWTSRMKQVRHDTYWTENICPSCTKGENPEEEFDRRSDLALQRPLSVALQYEIHIDNLRHDAETEEDFECDYD